MHRLALHSGESGERQWSPRSLPRGAGVRQGRQTLAYPSPAPTPWCTLPEPQPPAGPRQRLPSWPVGGMHRVDMYSNPPGAPGAPCRRSLTAGGDIAAGVCGVHLRDQVGAVLRALGDGVVATLPGLADNAAAALQAHTVLAVKLKVLPKLQGGAGEQGEEQAAPARPTGQGRPAACLGSPWRALWDTPCPLHLPAHRAGSFWTRSLTSQPPPAHQHLPAQAWPVPDPSRVGGVYAKHC